jgi:hypothetical protein
MDGMGCSGMIANRAQLWEMKISMFLVPREKENWFVS